jgi:hypothetical protein
MFGIKPDSIQSLDAGLAVTKLPVGGVAIRLPRPGIRHLPYVVKLGGGVTVLILVSSVLTSRSTLLLGLCLLLMASNVLLYGTMRVEWRVADGFLSVRRALWSPGQKWPVNVIGEIKRAPANAGLLVRIPGKDIVEIECGAEQETLERAAAILNEALAVARTGEGGGGRR